MEKKKAFTLIELMGVLVILGILTVILVPVINNTIKNNKEELYNKQLELIKLSAKNLASDNTYILPEEIGEEIYITLGQLRAMGYAEEKIINPLNNENFSNDLIVMIVKGESDYEYDIVIDGGTVISSSGIIVYDPSKKYIKEGTTSSYIITAKTTSEMLNSDSQKKVEYFIDLDKENIVLLGDASSDMNVKYKIDGSNGLYKLTIAGGKTEGYLYFNFKDIKDGEGKDVSISEINSEISNVSNAKQIMVDNTAPVINFTTNGTSVWAKSVKTNIEVTDNNGSDALDNGTYKYSYLAFDREGESFENIRSYLLSLVVNEGQSLTNVYNLTEEVSQENGDGTYYLVAGACDKAGNCNMEVSNKFLVDNTAPTCSFSGENSTWTTTAQTILVTGIDNHKMDSSRSKYTKVYNQSGIEVKTDNVTYEVADEAGNTTTCSKSVNVYYDTKAPTKPIITLTGSDGSGYDQGWTNKNIWTKANSTDNGSGINEYYIGHDANANGYTYSGLTWTKNINANKTEMSYLIDWEGSWDFYIKSCDNVGNCSTSDRFALNIDKTPPVVTCNASAAKLYQDGVESTITSYGDCEVYVTLENVKSLVTVEENNIFSMSGQSNYSISRYFCDDSADCATSNWQKTLGHCVDGYCKATVTANVYDQANNLTQKTFIYYAKY